MKRIVLAAVVVAALGAGWPAHATCGSVGDYNRGTVSFRDATGDVTIYAEQTGGALTGSVNACDDTSTSTTPAYGHLVVSVNNVVQCERSDVRLSSDPFGFGSGVHANDSNGHPTGPCGADVSWSEIGSVPSANTATNNGPDSGGAHTGVSRTTTMAGTYWLNSSAPITLPAGTTGTATRGSKVSAS